MNTRLQAIITSKRQTATNNKLNVDTCFYVCFGVFHLASYSQLLIIKNTTMKYSELKNTQQAAFNNFEGIIFAFTNKQLEEGLAKLNASISDIIQGSAGCFILKSRESALDTLLGTSNKEMKEALKDETFLQDALTYELCNHEYCITGNTRDALAALDLTSEEIPGHVMKASRIAASKDY